MNSISLFNNDGPNGFINALKAFFQELKVPVDYLADEPASANDILGGCYKANNNAHKLIEDVYALGIVNDDIFKGTETFKNLAELHQLKADYDGLLLFGVTLDSRKDGLPITRNHLAEITRAFNRAFPYTPVVIIFKYGNLISFANSERIPYKQEWREGEKAGKVTMLKDISIQKPHAAHLKILSNLAIDQKKIVSFQMLYKYWQSVFSLQALNTQFYADLQDWFYHASKNISLPFKPDFVSDKENIKNFLVRLLARTMFCWFIKEKGLIQKELLELSDWQGNRYKLTHDLENSKFLQSNSYYRGILQNIFFNALNQKEKKTINDFKWTQYWSKDLNLEWLINIPYLSGGIFDTLLEDNAKESIEDSVIQIPNFLFYGIEDEREVIKGKGAKATKTIEKVEYKGLNGILKSYKFTLDENTPFEEDIALDPEMLGLVFENLLAELDPNLEESAIKSIRKQTGSYYTPRKVIFEMVNDSLNLYLSNYLSKNYPDITNLKSKVNSLVYYTILLENDPNFDQAVVDALDKYKMLDPACGSGAFPMVMLHRIVDLLKLVDAGNDKWVELKLRNIDPAQKNEFKKVLTAHLDDYGRKLGIIRDSIYGIDIQPLAVQITKLRFFISLLIDQKTTKGITPMPNIETKIICADSLKNIQADLFSGEILKKLIDARSRYYQPDISKIERNTIADEIIDILDQAFPSFSQQVTGKNISGQNKVLLKEWFTHGTLAAPFFNLNFFYPELSQSGGFDCVIGNPPYGGSKISDEVRSALDIESKDPYGAFIARFLQRTTEDNKNNTPLKEGGVLAYIVSDTFMTIKSHLKLRKHLMQNYVHKMLRVHPDTFGATVNTVIMVVERNTIKKMDEGHICMMADLTNISIHDNYDHFVEVLNQTKGVDFESAKANISNQEFAIYYYPQALIKTNSNLPFFVASPKLFTLMNDSSKDLKKELKEIGGKQVQVRKIPMNGKEIEVVKLGDVGAAPHGISTGENKKYVRVKSGTKGTYDVIENWMMLPDVKLAKLSDNEKLNGLNTDWTRLKECFVPFEKGGESDSQGGWLPNYYVPTQFYINWGKGALEDMRKNPGVAWKNERYFFKPGLTFSISGIYAPTFRLNSSGVFEAKGSGLFCDIYQNEVLLGIIASKLAKFIFKNFIKHSVDTSGEDVASFILIVIKDDILHSIKSYTEGLIQNQKSNPRYDYASREQIEIDKLVYQAYGLNTEDVQEVENWYARRYTKLSAAQKANLRALGKSDDYLELYGLK
jgi:hypothetical protein